MNLVVAVITTLDNLDILKDQVAILRNDLLIDDIIVVNNGSLDGTKEWLDNQPGITKIHRNNNGAGPGRNAGLEAAGKFDYVLMLDGGIRPLIGGTVKMLEFLEDNSDIDVIGVEIADFELDPTKAWRRWPDKINRSDTYRNTRLSHTAYCMARYRAFDGIRFCEDGPFGEPGWGADDDELAYQWNDKDVIVNVVTGIHPFRRGSGSFRRLFKETGVWPNQYGSVYEKRVVWLQHYWAKYQPGVQWGEPTEDKTVIINAKDINDTIKLIKNTHDQMRADKIYPDGKYKDMWKPYQIIVRCSKHNSDFLSWAKDRCLRHHHGDTVIINDDIIKRNLLNEDLWTGDFILEIID